MLRREEVPVKRWIAGAVLLISALAWAGEPATFTKLQKIVGTWEAKTSDGKSSVLEVKSVSAGSVLMMMQPDEGYGQMVTMIHPDGDRVLLTHYCSAKNQPRMVADATPDGKTFKFQFLDATNTLDGQPGMMRGVTITLVDDDHMTHEWFFRGADGKDMHETFTYVRKK